MWHIFFVLYIFPFYTGYLWLTLLTSPSGLMTNHKSIASSLTAKNTPDIGHGVPPSTELWRSEAIGQGQCYSVHIQIHASIIIIIIMIFYPFFLEINVEQSQLVIANSTESNNLSFRSSKKSKQCYYMYIGKWFSISLYIGIQDFWNAAVYSKKRDFSTKNDFDCFHLPIHFTGILYVRLFKSLNIVFCFFCFFL